MSKVLKIFKQHILYVANSIFGTIPYTHLSRSTFAAFPKVFFVEGLKTEKKEHWQNKARMRFLRPAWSLSEDIFQIFILRRVL